MNSFRIHPICLHDIIPPADKTSSHVCHPHRIRMASSPSGSLLLFFSASFAFFFFLKLIFSLSRLDLTLCSWWAACCAKALDLGSLSVTVNRCLTLLPPSLSARCCLTLLTTKNTTRASTSRRPIATAITAHRHAGVDSFGGRKNRKWDMATWDKHSTEILSSYKTVVANVLTNSCLSSQPAGTWRH